MVFNRLISPYNRTLRTDKRNDWLVIHYVGAVSTAENNAKYFFTAYRGASAHYFADEQSIWQVVEDYNDAWHVGGAKKYYNSCRNNNSIAIEMCCKKRNSEWYIEEATIENTIWLATMICKKYNIPISRVVRHYDVTHKNCPEPFVRDEGKWKDFLRRLEANLMEDEEVELTMLEKLEIVKDFYGFDNNTGNYFLYYRYNNALIDKLYQKAKNG